MTDSNQPSAILIISNGPAAGKRFDVGAAPVTIGRHDQCDIQLEDRWMSRRHARLVWSGSGYVVEDLGSTNGVFVNGERVAGSRALKSGDILRLGEELELAFHAHLLPAAGKAHHAAVSSKKVPFLQRKSTRVWGLALLGVLLIAGIGGGVYHLLTDSKERAAGTPIVKVVLPETTIEATTTPIVIVVLPGTTIEAATPPELTPIPTLTPTATPTLTPTFTPTATSTPTNTPEPVLPTEEPVFSQIISLGPGRFGKPLWLEVIKGDYKLVNGTTLRTGSAISVYEDWLTFPVGLAINVVEGEITLKGTSYPPGTELVVNNQGRLEQR